MTITLGKGIGDRSIMNSFEVFAHEPFSLTLDQF